MKIHFKHQTLFTITLFSTFLAYPLIIKSLFPYYSTLIENGLILITFVFSLKLKTRVSTFPTNIKIFLYFYIIYLLFLILASLLFSESQTITTKNIGIELRDLTFIALLFIFTNKYDLIKIAKFYNLTLLVFSVLGIFLTILIYLNLIEPISTVYLRPPNQEMRLFYGIGFIWPDTWIGSLYGLNRLQSFTDEAGTFAQILTPTILFYFYLKQWVKLFITSLALVLTFSIGSIIMWFTIILLFLFSTKKSLGIKIILALLLFILIITIYKNIDNESSFLNTYLSAKYSTENSDLKTSAGQRIKDIQLAFNSILANPLGQGSGILASKKSEDFSLAVGWVIPFVEAGIIGGMLYLLAFSILLSGTIKTALKKGKYFTAFDMFKKITAITILCNGYMAFQRAGIDSNTWQLFWIAFYIKLSLQDKSWNHNNEISYFNNNSYIKQ